MEEFIQFSAKTKNEAITKACIELGVSSDQLEIEVVSEGSSGFFGIGSKPAIIKAARSIQFLKRMRYRKSLILLKWMRLRKSRIESLPNLL